MKILITIFLLMSAALPARSQRTATTCERAKGTGWDAAELCGRVKRIRTYETWYKKDERTGKMVAGERDIEEELSFDETGNPTVLTTTDEWTTGTVILTPNYTRDANQRITEIRYKRDDGVVDQRVTYKFDNKGNKIEEARYLAEDRLELRGKYVYDERGNIVEEELSQHVHPEHFIPRRDDVYVTTKRTFKYDSRNNQIEEKHFYPDGSLYGMWVRSFDAADRLIRELRTDKLQRPEDLTLNRYDWRGYLIAKTHYSNFCYNRDGSMCDGKLTTEAGVFYYGTRTIYKYDAQGNWVNQHEYTIDELAGLKSFEISHKRYRKINYY